MNRREFCKGMFACAVSLVVPVNLILPKNSPMHIAVDFGAKPSRSMISIWYRDAEGLLHGVRTMHDPFVISEGDEVKLCSVPAGSDVVAVEVFETATREQVKDLYNVTIG